MSFQVLRPFYEAAIAAAAEYGGPWTSGEESYRPSRHLLNHLVHAYRQGWLELPADGDLLDTAFMNVNAEDSALAWQQILHDWHDTGYAHPNDVERIARLLAWRLDRLEEQGRDEQRRRKEVKELVGVVVAGRVPDRIMLSLLPRAIRLSQGEVPYAGALWESLARLGAVDVQEAIKSAVLIIKAELRGDYPVFNYDAVAPVLRMGLDSQIADTRDSVVRVINDLAEHDFEEFKQLLEGNGI